MQTTPLPPLSWETPEFRDLFRAYWRKHLNDELPYIEPRDKPYTGPYAEIYHQAGYTDNHSVLPQSGLLDNEVHPIFHRSNWITAYPDFDIFFEEIQPALRLASKIPG